MATQLTEDALIPFEAVHDMTSLSRTTIWRMERRGAFPARRTLSSTCVRWLKSEVQAWVRGDWKQVA